MTTYFQTGYRFMAAQTQCMASWAGPGSAIRGWLVTRRGSGNRGGRRWTMDA
jgi:hypothetical protein